MKPVETRFILGALVCIISTAAAAADEYQKKGLPCVGELCIGDGLEEVSRVKWERDRNFVNACSAIATFRFAQAWRLTQ